MPWTSTNSDFEDRKLPLHASVCTPRNMAPRLLSADNYPLGRVTILHSGNFKEDYPEKASRSHFHVTQFWHRVAWEIRKGILDARHDAPKICEPFPITFTVSHPDAEIKKTLHARLMRTRQYFYIQARSQKSPIVDVSVHRRSKNCNKCRDSLPAKKSLHFRFTKTMFRGFCERHEDELCGWYRWQPRRRCAEGPPEWLKSRGMG